MFCTFIFKEVLRERQKDLLDDVKGEERTFAMQNEMLSIYQMIWEQDFQYLTEEKFARETVGAEGPTVDQAMSVRDMIDSVLRSSLWNLDDISTTIDGLGALCDKLDARWLSQELSDLASLRKDLEDARVKSGQFTKIVAQLDKMVFKDIESVQSIDFLTMSASLQRTHVSQADVVEAIRPLAKRVLEKGRAALRAAEGDYEFFTACSYGLYTLGFCLTLYGHLLGKDTPLSDQEPS